jgi:hypothetical protein
MTMQVRLVGEQPVPETRSPRSPSPTGWKHVAQLREGAAEIDSTVPVQNRVDAPLGLPGRVRRGGHHTERRQRRQPPESTQHAAVKAVTRLTYDLVGERLGRGICLRGRRISDPFW